MAQIKRTLLVYLPAVAEAAETLTKYGAIVGIDHEGTITFELEGEDEFELGRTSYEIEKELETLRCGHESKVVSAKPEARKPKEKAAA